MSRYAIKKNGSNKIVGILIYEKETKNYTIEIPMDVTEKEVPYLFALFLKKGIRRLDNDWSMRWVQSLLKNEGRSCQDEFYIEPLRTKFFVHYGSEHFDRNRFVPVKNDKNRKKPIGGLWGYPVNSEDSREEEHFFFRLGCPCNRSVIHSEEEWEKYPKQPQSTASGHPVLDYEKIAGEGVGDGLPIYAIEVEREDSEVFEDCVWGEDLDSVLVLNDAILIENYDAKITKDPLTLEDLLPMRYFKTLRKDIEVSCLLGSPDGKRYIYLEEPSTHYGFKTLVACISDGRIVEVCGYTESEAKAFITELRKYF